MDKAQRTSKTTLYALVFNLFPKKSSRTSRNQDFLFFQLFFYIFFPNRCNTSSNHKNLHLKQRWDVVYRKQEHFLKIGKQLRSLKTASFWFFFKILRSAPNGKVILLCVQNFVFFLLQKIEPKQSTERKVMPVLPKVTRVMVLRGHNLAVKPVAARAKLPWTTTHETAEQSVSPRASIPGICSNRYRQIKTRRAAMQGETTQSGLQPI